MSPAIVLAVLASGPVPEAVVHQPAAMTEAISSSPDHHASDNPSLARVPRKGVTQLTFRERILRRRRALRGGQQQSMDSLISLIQSTVAPDCWDFTGNAGGNAGSSGSRQGAENLAELIQQTVEPSSWEINGGNGSIDIFP